MAEPGETNQHQHQNSTPAEIRRKVAAHQVYKREARRRRRGYLRAALFLAVLALAAPVLIRHGHGLAHGCRSWLTHARRGHHRHHALRG